MNELSLFTGAGGGLLATKHLLGWKTIGYVEIDEYCQAILAQRIQDGLLDPAPIFGDIRLFINKGYAEAYQGLVDVITGGFPCQPFSVAGQRKGEQDERNLWPFTIECLRIIRPRYAFLENVPGLLATSYIKRIYGDLAEAGYDAQWCVLGADDMGAFHHRKRVFILAYPQQSRLEINGEIFRNHRRKIPRTLCNDCFKGTLQKDGYIWPSESEFRRMVNGIPYWMDRIKCTGEAQVPRVVEVAWEVLRPREKREG